MALSLLHSLLDNSIIHTQHVYYTNTKYWYCFYHSSPHFWCKLFFVCLYHSLFLTLPLSSLNHIWICVCMYVCILCLLLTMCFHWKRSRNTHFTRQMKWMSVFDIGRIHFNVAFVYLLEIKMNFKQYHQNSPLLMSQLNDNSKLWIMIWPTVFLYTVCLDFDQFLHLENS